MLACAPQIDSDAQRPRTETEMQMEVLRGAHYVAASSLERAKFIVGTDRLTDPVQ